LAKKIFLDDFNDKKTQCSPEFAQNRSFNQRKALHSKNNQNIPARQKVVVIKLLEQKHMLTHLNQLKNMHPDEKGAWCGQQIHMHLPKGKTKGGWV
jgi:hypothetical protein